MAKRGENIHKRKDGRWEGRYIRRAHRRRKARMGVLCMGMRTAKSGKELIKQKALSGFYQLSPGSRCIFQNWQRF